MDGAKDINKSAKRFCVVYPPPPPESSIMRPDCATVLDIYDSRRTIPFFPGRGRLGAAPTSSYVITETTRTISGL
jgi:hypothetical protein